jgi:tetratricopeptide (TPR) repeat protein
MKSNPNVWFFAIALLAPLAACGDDEGSETASGEEGTSGGENTSEGGSEGGGGQQASNGGGEDWDGDDPPGTNNGGTQGGNNGGETQAPPSGEGWESPLAEQGRPLPPRRPMTGSARSAYDRALNAAGAGNIAEAKRYFEEALSDDRNAFDAAYNLGVLADREGNEGRALEYYRRALSIQADYERAAAGIVAIHIRRGNVNDALAFIEPLATQWERNLHLQAIHAETLVEANRLDDAMRVARQALRRDERFVPAMIAIVKASLKQNRTELAEGIIDQALEVDANNAEIHYLRARMLLSQTGRLRDALSELRRAVELRPDFFEARTLLGIQLLTGANYTEALQQLQTAAALAPTSVAAQLNLADAYRASRQWQQAKSTFDRALQMESNLPQARFNMGLMYMTAGAEFPGLDQLAALRRAVDEFTAYRNMMGPRIPRDDPSATYIEDLNRQIQREQTRLEREATARQREAERAAREAAEGQGGGGGGEGGGTQ